MQISGLGADSLGQVFSSISRRDGAEVQPLATTVTGLTDPEAQETQSEIVLEADDISDEEAREKAEAQARMETIRDYIETYGAPEEKEQDWVQDTFLHRLQEEEDEKRKQGLPGNALNTWADVIQDPEDEGRTHVYAVKTDAEGKAKITRHVEFDSGDGEDRSQLTAERARANRAYARQMGQVVRESRDDESAKNTED